MPLKKIHERRDRRIARRRADILEAAIKVFSEKGIRQATTKEIAETADIAEGTIYNYFANKDDLISAVLEYLGDIEGRKEDYEAGLQQDIRTFFHDYLLSRHEALQERGKLIGVIFSEVINTPELRDIYMSKTFNPAITLLEQHLQTRVDREELPPIDVATVTRLITSMVLGLQILIATGDETTIALWQDAQTLTDSITNLLFDGVAGQRPKP